MDRLSTGSNRLDAVLGGGLVENSITLIVGAPGSGKTILAEQCLFENAAADRPGLYFSTVSEPFDKLLRYGQSLEFFEVEKIGKVVFYDDLGDALVDGGLTAVLDRIDETLKVRDPGIVVIDSFKALKTFAADDGDFRRFLRALSGRFTALATTSVWVGEYEAAQPTDSPEFAVADSIITLETRRTAERSVRYISVRKIRGSDFQSGDHAYRVTANGLQVFPRLADPLDQRPRAVVSERVSTGVAALDDALEDGYWPGSTTLIVGPSGVGKTLMGLHFLFEGGHRSEPGLLVTLQENRTQLERVLGRFGWSFDDPNVTILDRSPVDIYIDELVYELFDAIEEVGARRVVIDSLADLALASPDMSRFSEFIYSLAQRCAYLGVSLMFTYETVELFNISRLSDSKVSHIADNVVLLQYVLEGSEMKRALTVLKSRASTTTSGIREFRISSKGIELGRPIDPRPHASETRRSD